MTNAVKQSLLDNQEAILEELPKEFHEDFKASIESAESIPALSEEDAKKEAIEAIKHNETIAATTDQECQAFIDNADVFQVSIAPLSDDELEQQKAEMLKEASAQATSS